MFELHPPCKKRAQLFALFPVCFHMFVVADTKLSQSNIKFLPKNPVLPFCVHYQSGLSAVGPRHKGLFEKSPLEPQKLRKNEVGCLSKVLWHTFLRNKGVFFAFLFLIRFFALIVFTFHLLSDIIIYG